MDRALGHRRPIFARSDIAAVLLKSVIPLGYMAKHVERRPKWLKVENVDDVYSVSSCVSDDFCEYVGFWRHNGYWFFDSPQAIWRLARDESIDLEGTKFFYYEAFELEYCEDVYSCSRFLPEEGFPTAVEPPDTRKLEGYDIVTFSQRNKAQCSPLSCNHMAESIAVNQHCLLNSLEDAKKLIEEGRFKDCEPGPYRIIAVYSLLDE